MQPFFKINNGFTRAYRAVTLLAFCVVLTACSGNANKPDAEPEPNIPPVNYKDDIILAIRGGDEDPTGIRDAAVTIPALKPSGSETRFISCLRYNAKKLSGGPHTGIKEVAAIFYAGKLTAMLPATKEQCAKAPYQPFPELEKLCRELVCPGAR